MFRPVVATVRVRRRIGQFLTSLVRSAGSGIVAGVFAAAFGRFRAFATRAMAGLNATWRRLTRPVPLVAGVVGDLLRSRRELIAENALLRQQLIVASRKIKRPSFRPHERGLLVLLARLVPRWRNALLLVKPETVLKWHRAGLRRSMAPSMLNVWSRPTN